MKGVEVREDPFAKRYQGSVDKRGHSFHGDFVVWGNGLFRGELRIRVIIITRTTILFHGVFVVAAFRGRSVPVVTSAAMASHAKREE